MIDLKNKKIVIFTPGFFNYDNEICNELVNRGADVFHYNERGNPNNMQKFLIRKIYFLEKSRIKKYYEKVIEEINNRKIDFFLFVNPEAVNYQIIIEMKKAFPKASFILYMWDSIKNKRRTIKILPLFHKCFSFDEKDTFNCNLLTFRPLFFIKQFDNSFINDTNDYDFTFIGTVHSDRYRVLRKIKERKESKKIFYYCYFQSKLLYIYNRIFNPIFYGSKISDFKFDCVDNNDLLRVLKSSRVIIDIHHPNQSGLTMRTIESVGLRKKLITTNACVKKYDFFNKNILVIDRENPIIPDSFLDQSYELLNNKIYYKYSISGWVDDIFSL